MHLPSPPAAAPTAPSAPLLLSVLSALVFWWVRSNNQLARHRLVPPSWKVKVKHNLTQMSGSSVRRSMLRVVAPRDARVLLPVNWH